MFILQMSLDIDVTPCHWLKEKRKERSSLKANGHDWHQCQVTSKISVNSSKKTSIQSNPNSTSTTHVAIFLHKPSWKIHKWNILTEGSCFSTSLVDSHFVITHLNSSISSLSPHYTQLLKLFVKALPLHKWRFHWLKSRLQLYLWQISSYPWQVSLRWSPLWPKILWK